MSNLDSKVAAVLDNKSSLTTEEDEDDLISQLENDNDNVYDNFREQRLQQLHAEIAREKQLRNQEHGSYSEVKEEKKLMELTTSSKLCIVHFFKHDFNRCRIMDSHLEVRDSISGPCTVPALIRIILDSGSTTFGYEISQDRCHQCRVSCCQA